MPDHILHTGVTISETAFRFRTSRSSGPGGQNVNKLDTRVELVIEMADISGLTEEQAGLLRTNLKHRIDTRDRLHFVSQKFRTQGQNKGEVVRMALEELTEALVPEAARLKTKPGRAVKENRLEKKRIQSARKQTRKPLDAADDV